MEAGPNAAAVKGLEKLVKKKEITVLQCGPSFQNPRLSLPFRGTGGATLDGERRAHRYRPRSRRSLLRRTFPMALMGGLHPCFQEGQHIVSPYIAGRGAESPVSALMGATESRIDLEVLVLLVRLLAQSPGRREAVIVLSLNQEDGRLAEVGGAKEELL